MSESQKYPTVVAQPSSAYANLDGAKVLADGSACNLKRTLQSVWLRTRSYLFDIPESGTEITGAKVEIWILAGDANRTNNTAEGGIMPDPPPDQPGAGSYLSVEVALSFDGGITTTGTPKVLTLLCINTHQILLF